MIRRTLLSATLIGAALLIPVSSANAIGSPGSGSQNSLTYYSDAQHTTIVGAQGYDCQGNPWRWGSTSPYTVYRITSCSPLPN